MRGTRATHRWLQIPLGLHSEREVPTWGALAERYARCLGRAAFYVGRRVPDPGASARIVTMALERNVDLLLAEHGELEELRRLRATADRLITSTRVSVASGSREP
jgi:hypothetical protein